MPNFKEAENFEQKQLKGVFNEAMIGAILHKCTAWFGAGTLAWATIVLMGGFAGQIHPSDFVRITILVIATALLLALALLTSKLVTKKSLYRGSLDPVNLCYRDQRLALITVIQFISVMVQLVIFVIPSAYIAMTSLLRDEFEAINVKGLLFSALHRGFDSSPGVVADLQACLHNCASLPLSNSTVGSLTSCVQSCFPVPTDTVSNLDVCLFTFFCLVLCTCGLAFLYIAYYIASECFLWRKLDLSLKKYHDEVMSRALNVGLVEADEFDAKEFFLRCLGDDLALRNIAPLEVKRQNLGLVKYLLYHPKGVEMVYEGLVSGDTIQQQTSANIVGFWAPHHDLENNRALLSRLAEKLGQPGKTAEAAANSFSVLASQWSDKVDSPLLSVMVACDGGGLCNVVERTVDLILRSRLPTLQVYMRLIDSFFMSQSICLRLASKKPQDMEDIVKKLKDIVDQEAGVKSSVRTADVRDMRIDVSKRDSIRARTAFLAFSALDHLMDFGKATSSSAALNNLKGTPTSLSSVDLAVSTVSASNQRGDGVVSDNDPQDSEIRADTSLIDSEGTTKLQDSTSDTKSVNLESDASSITDAASDFTCSSGTSATFDKYTDAWHTQARELLHVLDTKLKTQEFMWWEEAERYRALCTKYWGGPSANHGLGAWLAPMGPCKIRGEDMKPEALK